MGWQVFSHHRPVRAGGRRKGAGGGGRQWGWGRGCGGGGRAVGTVQARAGWGKGNWNHPPAQQGLAGTHQHCRQVGVVGVVGAGRQVGSGAGVVG